MYSDKLNSHFKIKDVIDTSGFFGSLTVTRLHWNKITESWTYDLCADAAGKFCEYNIDECSLDYYAARSA